MQVRAHALDAHLADAIQIDQSAHRGVAEMIISGGKDQLDRLALRRECGRLGHGGQHLRAVVGRHGIVIHRHGFVVRRDRECAHRAPRRDAPRIGDRAHPPVVSPHRQWLVVHVTRQTHHVAIDQRGKPRIGGDFDLIVDRRIHFPELLPVAGPAEVGKGIGAGGVVRRADGHRHFRSHRPDHLGIAAGDGKVVEHHPAGADLEVQAVDSDSRYAVGGEIPARRFTDVVAGVGGVDQLHRGDVPVGRELRNHQVFLVRGKDTRGGSRGLGAALDRHAAVRIPCKGPAHVGTGIGLLQVETEGARGIRLSEEAEVVITRLVEGKRAHQFAC